MSQFFLTRLHVRFKELTFDDGRVVRCTKDHKFLTEGNNWVQAEHLCENVSRVIDIVKTPVLLVK